jgi:pimeloyl-ACP methyl ester carboxylesterase
MRYLTKGIPIIIFLMFAFIACSSDNDRDAEAELGVVTTDQQESAMIPSSTNQQIVRSADGTRIAYTKVGSGPIPLVMVHGALNTSQQWTPVAGKLSELSDQYTSYVVDRWGRGGSEGRPDYSLEHDVNDIIAVLEEAGPDSYLLGHSGGAIISLEAAKRAQITGLILYEPPLHGFHGKFVDDIWERMHSAAKDGRYEESLAIFLTEEAGVPAEALSEMQTTPHWDHLLEHTPHTVAEIEALVDAQFEVDRYKDISVPTLMLAGTETADHPSFATQALDDLLPNARTAWLDGEGHVANETSPEMVAQEIIEFVHN